MNLSPPPGTGSTSGSTSEGILKADWVDPAPWPALAGANPPLLDESEADEEAPEPEDEDEEEEAHPVVEVANINGVLVDLSEADQDLANNNDPNNNAANLNAPLLEGQPDLAIQPAAPTLAESDPSPEEPPENAPDESEASHSSSSSHEVSFKVDLPTDNPGEGSSGCSEASESLESGSPHGTLQQCPKYEALKADALLILKFMPGKSFEEIHHYLEAHMDNPARVQVVLNEFLEEVEQKSESSSKSSKFRSSSSQPMELSASSSGTDSDSEINLVKNKSGNGLKAKNSKLSKPSSDPPPGPSGSCETKASRGVLRKSHSGRKRLISLDPNLSDEDLDFKSKIAHTNVETTTTTAKTRDEDDPGKPCKPVGDRGVKRRWSKKSSKDGGGLLRRQHERSKIQLSEKHLHGPYNFYDHRKRGAPSSSSPSGTSTSDAFASSRPRGKIEFKALRKDLQVIVDNNPDKGNLSNSSARSGAAMSGPSTESKNGNDSPPVVDLRDLPPSPVVVVDLSDADQSEKRELLGSFTNMFPGTPVEYLVEQADELAGKPAAIERFIMELLARESKPPDYWVPKAQRPPELGFSVGSNAAGPPLNTDPSLVNGDEVLFPIDGGTYPN
ncbi:hypothetical protein TCAL_11326 [Tigriopus californicus]|uniref:Uncharacterized protein n=2 Tax=Tigriopus californicus TaxID=6832 RepID=A0A553N9I6_TIGCA|nr:hypothetical protein TCAL_11326 [Tigriopus californicus]